MFIINRNFWGPVAGVATALLLVFAMNLASNLPDSTPVEQPAPAATIAYAPAH